MPIEPRKAVAGLFLAGAAGALLFPLALYQIGLALGPPRPVPVAASAPPLVAEAIWARAGGGQAAELTPMSPVSMARFLGCVAYEALTARTLFEGSNEVALITAHVSHDGQPAALRELLSNRATARFGELLSRMLRSDPLARASIGEVRSGLDAVRAELSSLPWPIAGAPKASLAELRTLVSP